MKKIISLISALVIMLSLFPTVVYASDGVFSDEQINYYKNLGLQGTTINVYNWGEYISDGSDNSLNVVKEFEKLTGAKVNYTNFESNENMYSKLSGGGVSYDVIVPSDYMIGRLIDENMLLEIDWNNVPNESKIADEYKHLYFDKEQNILFAIMLEQLFLFITQSLLMKNRIAGIFFGITGIKIRF